MIKFNKLDYKILNNFKYVIMALAIMFLSVNIVSALNQEEQLTTDSNNSIDASGELEGQGITIDSTSPYFNYVKAGIRRFGTPSDLIIRVYSDTFTNPENMLEVTIPYSDIPTTSCPSTPDINIPLGYVSQGADWSTSKTDFNIAFTATTLDSSNYYRICAKSTGGYSGGYRVHSVNSGANWLDDSPGDLQFQLFYDSDHFNISWDSLEYAKGQTGTVTATFNSSSYNSNIYQYILDVRDPVTYEHTYLTFNNNPISSNTYTFKNVGEYDINVFVKTYDIDSTHYYDRTDNDIIVSSLLNPQSFLSWQYAEYTEGDEGKLSWGISDSVQYYLLTKNIILYKDGYEISRYENLNYFGSINYKFPVKGLYRADLVLSSPITDQIIKSHETNVVLGDSYLNTNHTLETGFLNNFTYIWGFTPTQSGYKWLYVKYFNKDTYAWETENTVAITGTVKNTQYNSSFLVKKEGEYLLELCDLNRKCPAVSLKVKAVFVPQKPINSYSSSNLTILSTLSSYAQGDILKWRSQVKGSDYQDKTITIEIRNNATNQNYTLVYVQNDFEERTYFLGQLYGGGASMLQMIGTNGTGRYILVQTPLTMSFTDSLGWGLDISDTLICLGDTVQITAISPTNSTIRFTDKKITYYNFTGTHTWNIKPGDDMTISLEDSYGTQKKSGFINLDDTCDAIIIDDSNEINSISDLEYSTTGAGRKLDEFILVMGMGLNDTSKLIFGVLMIVISIIVMYLSTQSVFVSVASGSAIFIWMLAIEYIPLWVVILVAIVLILKARQGE